MTRIAINNNGVVTSLKVVYKTDYGSYFEVDGDLVRTLEVEGSSAYVSSWIREKLRKMENGQIKVLKNSDYKGGKKRDWEQEEEIKKQMWDDVNVNVVIPKGRDHHEIICTKPIQTQSSVEYKRSPSPSCKIS